MKELRRRVDALRRKMAVPLAVVRLCPVAEEMCQQWEEAAAQNKPAPEPLRFIRKVRETGLRLPTFMALHRYIDNCREKNRIPQPYEIIRALLPWNATRHLIHPALANRG